MLQGANGNRWVYVGRPGCGKTTLLEKHLQLYVSRGFGVTIFQTNGGQLARFGDSVDVTQAVADVEHDWPRLLADHRQIRFVMMAADPMPFLERAVAGHLAVGNRVVVFDDPRQYLPPVPSRAVDRLWMEGRRAGVHVLTVGQKYKATGRTGLPQVAKDSADGVLVFQANQDTEVTALASDYPTLTADVVRGLAYPGGYVMLDAASGRAQEYHPDHGVRDLHHGNV